MRKPLVVKRTRRQARLMMIFTLIDGYDLFLRRIRQQPCVRVAQAINAKSMISASKRSLYVTKRSQES